MAKLTIVEVNQKTTKGGKPYLSVKSSSNKWYYVWDTEQYIWHMMVVGATIEPILATQGNFTAIKGIIGVDQPNESGGVTVATNKVTPEKVYEKLLELEKKVDFLIEEKKTLNSLPDLNAPEIRPEDIPF